MLQIRNFPWLLLLTVAIMHGTVAWLGSRPDLSGDEPRFWLMAENLTRGGFASQETRLLWNGPGYPLTLWPWFYAHASPLWPRLVNALWMSVGAFAAWQWFRDWKLPRPALQAFFLSLYLLFHGSLSDRLMSEPLAAALVTLVACFLQRTLAPIPVASNSKFQRAAWVVATALVLAWLLLTKVFFAYAALVALLMALGLWAFQGLGKKAECPASNLVAILILAFLFCSPYLLYTQKLTGRFFYWANSGGAQLYCLTLPEPRFLGDWLNSDAVLQNPEFFGDQSRFYARLDSLDYVTQDDSLKAAAWRNIREHPAKVFQNWRANVNRLVFGQPLTAYPGGSLELKTGNRSFVQALWFYAGLPALVWIWLRRRKGNGRSLPPGWIPLALFSGISLFGLTLLSTEPRMVFPLLPVLYGCIAWIFQRGVIWRPGSSR